MLKSFIHYYKPHWKLFVFDMVCALVAASCDLMYPVISRNIINTYIPDKNLRLILTWCVALLVTLSRRASRSLPVHSSSVRSTSSR